MSNRWAIEAHTKTGRTFLYRRVVTRKKIGKLIAQVMNDESTGGIVIYRSTVAKSKEVYNDAPDDHPGYAATLEKVALHNDNPNDYEGEDCCVNGEPGCTDPHYWPAESPGGSCKTCGCPPKDMPMINRNTDWCCESCRKQQL